MIIAELMAEVDVDVFSSWTKPGSVVGQLALVVGAVFVVGFVIFLWAGFIRKPRRRKLSHHHASDYSGDGSSARDKRRSPFSHLFRKKRHKRHHSRERPLNPTLSQIGGLPPRRDDHRPS